MMKNNKNNNDLKYTITLCLVCAVILSLAVTVLYYLLQINTSMEYRKYYSKYKPGMICEDSFVLPSDIDIINEQETKALREKNRDSVLPVFVYSLEKTVGVLEKIDSLRLTELDKTDISAAYEIARKILIDGFYVESEIENYSEISVIKESESTVELDDNVVTRRNLSFIVDELLSQYPDSVLNSENKLVVKTIVERLCEPNVFYDEMLTSSRKNNAYDSTQPAVTSYKKGLVVLQPDTVISEYQIELLHVLGNRKTVPVFNIISTFVFSLLGLCLIFSTLYIMIKSDTLHRNHTVLLITIFTLMAVAITYFGQIWSFINNIEFFDVCIPMCFIPVAITMFTGKKSLGFVAVFVTEFIVSILPGTDYYTFFYVILCGIVCCYSIQFMNRRLDMLKQALFNLISNLIFTVLFMLIRTFSFADILKVLILCTINILGTHLFLAIAIPLFERIFNYPTLFRLHELAYGDSPLLEKLSQSASGTYNHSRNVAELADKACRDIGANALLARVGALYHDVGKIDYPEYFVENQSGENLHEDLNPSLSVSIIKNHVKSGADKGREAKLPVEVIDIIANHHGNDVISYFYNEAKKQNEDNQQNQQISSIDYSYNNCELPKSKECAVVMLADGVEAAIRTVQDPTPAKFAKTINSIVFGKIDRGQLNNCSLSMKEINTVCDSFLKTLSAIHHSRIKYPDEVKK